MHVDNGAETLSANAFVRIWFREDHTLTNPLEEETVVAAAPEKRDQDYWHYIRAAVPELATNIGYRGQTYSRADQVENPTLVDVIWTQNNWG